MKLKLYNNFHEYDVLSELPVAKFYYKGNHSHPIRRTVLVIEKDKNHICGYELREGKETRKLQQAPVKTFLIDRIAKQSQLGARKHRIPGPNITSLKRFEILELLINGA